MQIVENFTQNNCSIRQTHRSQIDIDFEFPFKILFSNEAHFWWNGYVNKQNCRIWSGENPQAFVETPLHPQKITLGWRSHWPICLQKRCWSEY